MIAQVLLFFQLLSCAYENTDHGLNLYALNDANVLVKVSFIASSLSDRKSTRLNSSHSGESRMPSSA